MKLMISVFHGFFYRLVAFCFLLGISVSHAAIPLEQPAEISQSSAAVSKTTVPLAAITEELRQRFEVDITTQPILSKQLNSLVAISRFYTQRQYRPAWLTDTGLASWPADLLLALAEADREGLRATDYPIDELQQQLNAAQNNVATYSVAQWADLELRVTDTWFTYGEHRLGGRLNPHRIDREWGIKDHNRDLVPVLQDALTRNQAIEVLATLVPPHSGYERLRQALADYRTLEDNGGWVTISSGAKLAKGSRHGRVKQLRIRLLASGDLTEETAAQDTLFDDALSQAVKRFQRRHGLTDDGVVGPKTLAELNIPVAERARQIELNLERWRWLPDDFGRRHLLVNITDFTMSVIEDGRETFGTKVVVGRTKRPTPIFNADMSYMVLNPKWYVPYSIAVKDKLPKLRRNAYSLTGQRIRVYSGKREVDPGTVNWHQVSAKNFPYRLRQDPGPSNALGRVKFMFPNPYSVYLHDTPSRNLFTRDQRTFSSGCIRVADPIDLAEYLLKDDPRWNRKKILSATRGKWQKTVHLAEKIPVYLLYWTAWVDEDGTVNFRDDIYQRDRRLARAWSSTQPSGV
ncbi:MAG: L,D-transpeptidase family protein [Candidatus Competibacteraceae bacterium]|jgi:murein L,D-transpeptidase YcbB/YkuD|nr:L,D-transpeptidase family protein [Candidatus Competibacteraceae bacterium]